MTKRTIILQRISKSVIAIFLGLIAAICIFPVIHLLAVSLSSSAPVMAGQVTILPVDFTFNSYDFVMKTPNFINSFLVSVKRELLGIPISLCMTVLVAFPLSREPRAFRARKVFVVFFLITMLFSGGLIPMFMVISGLKLTNTMWALVLPGAVQIFNAILLMNFFRELPKELEEAAFMDGAGQFTSLTRIYLPLSKPVIATITLFVFVSHWNAWFDGLIYMKSQDKYPLQSLLQTLVVSVDTKLFTEHTLSQLKYINNRTARAAEIFVSMIPILCVYPFLQKYFTTGIVLGSVKG